MKQHSTSSRCRAQMKAWETFTPIAMHLPGDRQNVITGGYGFTDVQIGQVFTETEASARFDRKLETHFEPIVDRAVLVEITEGMYDALVSFVYNIGPGDPHEHPPIEGLLTSTLLRKLNARDFTGAAAEFPRWNGSNGQILLGLIRRRQMERSWFES